MGLRIIDSIILPINTTQYSLELDDYLNECVASLRLSYTQPLKGITSVESLVPGLEEMAHEVQFFSLRESIRSLQDASLKLDNEKFEAEEDFKKLLKRMRFPGRGDRRVGRRTGLLRHAADWIKSLFGVPPPTDEEIQLLSLRSADSWEEYLEYVARFGDEHSDTLRGEDIGLDGMRLPGFPIRRFIKAAKRVQQANQKLIRFERGFISKDGIKDREWYKHLGVAPGKWLGKQEIIPSSFKLNTFIHQVMARRHSLHLQRPLYTTRT